MANYDVYLKYLKHEKWTADMQRAEVEALQKELESQKQEYEKLQEQKKSAEREGKKMKLEQEVRRKLANHEEDI